MARDARGIELDWLNLRSLVDSSMTFVAENSIGMTRFHSSTVAVANILREATMASIVFGLIMGTLLALLWIERKLLGRLMDRRGAMTSLRSLWAGEGGVDAGEWWHKVPYGLGKPIGWGIRTLQRIHGNRAALETVDRVNDRSYLGWPIFPGLFQNAADGAKLLQKEWMIPEKADRMMFEVAPFIIISSTVMILGMLPLGPAIYGPDPDYGVLMAMAIFGVAPLGVFFAGWASNNKYTLIGGIRSAAQLTAYEIPLLLVVLSVCVLAGTFNFREIVQAQIDAHTWNLFLMPLGFLLFIVAMVAEVERIPFDMPEAEAELVEGWWTEYGGMRWGLMFAAEYLRVYAACILATIFFLGGWQAPFGAAFAAIPGIGNGINSALYLIPGVVWVLLKSWAVFCIFVWIRAALPRVRTDQILEFGWRWLLPISFVNLVISITLRLVATSSSGWFGWDILWAIPLSVGPLLILILYTFDEGEDLKRPEPITVSDVSEKGIQIAARNANSKGGQ